MSCLELSDIFIYSFSANSVIVLSTFIGVQEPILVVTEREKRMHPGHVAGFYIYTFIYLLVILFIYLNVHACLWTVGGKQITLWKRTQTRGKIKRPACYFAKD